MYGSAVWVFPIFLTFLFSGACTKRLSTCRDVERQIRSRDDEIESLKLTLEEYKLGQDEKEDKSDDCIGYPTCFKCLREKTNCGWCFLHNRCSLQENCPGSESNSDFWISSVDGCPKIGVVKPHQIAAHTASMLQINIPHLPNYDGQFLCSFEVLQKTLFTKGIKTDTGIDCPSPHKNKIPEIPQDNVDLPVKLSVRIPSGPNFVSTTNFTIFACQRHTSCSECASSPYPCAWCVGSNRCTHDVNENCRNDIIVFSRAVTRPTFREGPVYCPKILPNSGSGNEIFVHSGTKKRIYVKVENIVQLQVTSRFICEVSGVSQVTGQLLGDVVYCDEMKFKVFGRNPVSNLKFNLYWGNGAGKMDNDGNLHVVVYHCGLMASSCGECLDLPDQYNCGWCEESNSCTTGGDCGEVWMDKRQTCTKPEIRSFYPKSGLLTRQTNITIKGINLGEEFKNIDRVRLTNEENGININCTPLEHLFVKHSQIVCQLDVPEIDLDSNGTVRGHFEVKVSNSFVTVSEDEYSFVDPAITEFEPVKGIKSGGTLLKIKGHHLDAGSSVQVFIGDLPCTIISRDSSTIICMTSPSPRTTSSAVKVIFDGEEKTSNAYFFYVEDPYIGSVKSETGTNYPSGTLSGGNLIIVQGEYFDHVPNPYIYVIVDDVEYPGGCRVKSDKQMDCISPRLPADVLNFCNEEGYMTFDYGFRMGDVEDVRNISFSENFNKFRVYPDPFFMPFAEEGKTKIWKSDYITINGRYLDTAFDERDITVQVGDEECVVTSLSRSQLTCRPPAAQPRAKDGDGSKLPEVVVRVQERHEFFIGFLRYSNQESITF